MARRKKFLLEFLKVSNFDDAEMGESCLNFGVLGIGAGEKKFGVGKFELIDFVVKGVAGGIKGNSD